MLHLKCVMNWCMTVKPGFHMMATIVTIAVIGEKISSSQRCVMNWWMTFKPGFHMMATIVTIAMIGEKISSLQRSSGNHFPAIVVFAVITVTMIFEIEKVISFSLQSLEIVFQLLDPYDRWAFFSAIVRITVIVGIVAFIWKLGFTLIQS